MRPSVIFGLALLNTVAQAKWQIDETSCKEYDIDHIKEELEQAHKMALAGKSLLNTKGKTYYENFMSAKAQKTISEVTKSPASKAIEAVFQNSADLLNEKGGNIEAKITCDNKTPECQDKKLITDAHTMKGSGTKVINLCDKLLIKGQKVSDLQEDCDFLNMGDVDKSFAVSLVHETMHFKEVMKPILGTSEDENFQDCLDFATGVVDCLDLADGQLPKVKRSLIPTQKICSALKNSFSTKSNPSQTKDGQTKDSQTKDGQTKDGQTKTGQTKTGQTKTGQTKDSQTKGGQTKKKTSRAEEGCQDEEFTMMNADSYALIAGGAYFTDLCKREIPLEVDSESSASGSPKADSPKAGSPKAGSPPA